MTHNLCYIYSVKTNMHNSLYVVSKSKASGSMLITLGFAELLQRRYGRIAFFRPLADSQRDRDPDAETILSQFALDQSYDEAVGMALDEAEKMLADNKMHLLIEMLLKKFLHLQNQYDFVLCSGLLDEALASVIDFDLNVELAKNFNTPIVGVIRALNEDENSLKETVRLWHLAIEQQGAEPFMLFANRCTRALYEKYHAHQTFCPDIPEPVILLPDIIELDRPNVYQLAAELEAAQLIADETQMQRICGAPRIAAMHLEHFLPRIQQDDLIIVPADRSDIILGAMVANYANNFPAISAILLTGNLAPAKAILELVNGIDAIHIPLLHVEEDTMKTASRVQSLEARIDVHSPKKIATALGVFNENIDNDAITAALTTSKTDIITPVMFEHRLFEQAAREKKMIILPETEDERILRAADILLRRRAVKIVLLGNKTRIITRAEAIGLHLNKAIFVDPSDRSHKRALATMYQSYRSHKGMTFDAAYDALSNATLFATMMVASGECDGMVSGATHTTRETILPALQTFKTAPGYTIVSSCFFMCFDTRVLVYADCAVNPDPSAAELAEIAIASAETAVQFGIEPRVAMLSYSTGDSGVGSDVDKVRAATQLVRTIAPDLVVDGPMQYDAAIDPEVGKQKMPSSPVAGRATVFIFPDLNTGNNTYKAVQRSAGAIAIGPVLQGLARPVNDLSRGATVTDIVNTVAITAIQTQQVPS